MAEFYSEIRLVHIWAVYVSGLLIAVRGISLLAPVGWIEGVLRWVTYTADTVLLTAALMLMTVVQQYPFVDGWLTVKVLLLVALVVLRGLAFSDGPPQRVRVGCWAGSLAVYGFIVSIAWTRNPLGILAG
jgi:uncharacterized membrane protein SirB2